ncbi:MAG: sugar ABC transporter ATP-binding protein, partial [Alicyclobacillus sp.]|nr:sugar ABC transporter ATP-binding protein [Alicyclobacillus sp.]
MTFMSAQPHSAEPFIRLSGLTKRFAGNTVLHQVSFDIRPGEFHGLIGENGAGKSTLIHILTGVYQPDAGSIAIDGRTYHGLNPVLAAQAGIQAVHQELSLSPHLTITENIFLGCERTNRLGLRKKDEMRQVTRELLSQMGLGHLSPDTRVHRLPLAEQQLVEFAKAVYQKPRLLILDEATSALAPAQVEIMFSVLRQLQRGGMGIIFVSHRLQEMFDICETITVLKDGNHVVTRGIDGLNHSELVSLMTGRDIGNLFPPKPDRPDTSGKREVMRVEGLTTTRLRGVDFVLHEGEILGLGGLQGQGQQELLGALFGIQPIRGGSIRLFGQHVQLSGPQQAMRMGIAYLPEDRKTEGLFLPHSIRFNLSFATLRELSDRLGTIRIRSERNRVQTAMQRLRVKAVDMHQPVRALSGGNQQKVVLAKWLERKPK